MIRFLLEQLRDNVARENFQKLDDYLRNEPMLKSQFQHFELTFKKTESNIEVRHGLGFIPKDIIQTFLKGDGTVSWVYNSFTDTTIKLTVGGTVTANNPTTIRFLLGNYQ